MNEDADVRPRRWQAGRELYRANGPYLSVSVLDGTLTVITSFREDGPVFRLQRWGRRDPWSPLNETADE